MIHIELICNAQDGLALDALRVTDAPLLPEGGWRKIVRHSGGSTFRHTIASSDALIRRLASSPFNELGIKIGPVPFRLLQSGVNITQVAGGFRLSSTNALWSEPRTWPRPFNQTAFRAGASYGCTRAIQKLVGSHSCPSFLNLYLTADEPVQTDETCRVVGDVIASALANLRHPELVSGYADLLPQSRAQTIWLDDIWGRLARHPRAIPMLGSRFDKLHNVLFGDAALCSDLREMLGDAVRLSPVTTQGRGHVVSVVAIPEEILTDPAAAERARACLVPLDASTEEDPANLEGTFRLPTRTFETHRRFVEFQDERFPTLSELRAREYWVIAPKYCQMMGIDPDDMIVHCAPEGGVRYNGVPWLTQAEVDAAFDALPEGMPLEERIWASHFPAWKRQFPDPPAISFIHDRYCPSVPVDPSEFAAPTIPEIDALRRYMARPEAKGATSRPGVDSSAIPVPDTEVDAEAGADDLRSPEEIIKAIQARFA